ncbi:GNAT family N-acetyltransferase [Actinomyces sp. B33]|uniref:GNAT family N-acetyltransferase n=1 Tax=Actinomyces sp. B33 TaxID=2942131 RepID=UPI0023427EF6|nr:GNAT family N-acetyltransferase [Actinomyces sp. B33]MDC4233363.1 GNAT family N-acetyltransferase [Actinomyces sp. B33]
MSAIPPFSVDGETIRLVPIGMDDAQDLTAAILSDPRISDTTQIPTPYRLDMARENLAGSAAKWEGGSADWAIRDRADGTLIGRLELIRGVRDRSSLELAYFVDARHRGRGVMTEAVRLAVVAAFETMGADRVEWYAHVGNWASWKPAWRAGLAREGVRRRRDKPDLWQAAILAGEPMEPAAPWDGPGPAAASGPALDPSRPMALVEQFHRTYSMPVRLGSAEAPTLDYERLGMRMSLICEEFAELMGAVYGDSARDLVEEAVERAVDADDATRDLVETADALADLVYVIYGMALESGIDLDAVLAEVQASNLSKLMPDGSVKLREDGKVLKGPDFFAPDVARALGIGRSI